MQRRGATAILDTTVARKKIRIKGGFLMTLSEEELALMLRQNPNLRVKDLSNPKANDKVMQSLRKELEVAAQKKTSKYRNHKVYIYEDGFADISGNAESRHGRITSVYDSQREYQRHNELRLLERAGEIHDLSWQFPLLIQEAFQYNNQTIQAIRYVADFRYFRSGDDQPTIEDVKGLDMNTGRHILTKDFLLKWKLLKFRYPKYQFVIF